MKNKIINNLVVCEHCRTEVNYKIFKRQVHEEIDNVNFTYEEEYALCEKCKNEVYVSEIHDKNLFNYNEAYKRATGIITIDEINQIISKYNIGKKPLSILLGWGEGTISRYISGDFPSKKYSDILKDILISEKSMLNLLEENKSSITNVAYEKSLAAINSLIKNKALSIQDLAKYITCTHDITPKALQKILYYIQGFSMSFNNEPLFYDIPEAWVHGPVYPEVYSRYSNFKYNIIEEDSKNIKLNLEESDQNLIDCILKFFTKYSGDVLEKITHIELPWLNARKGIARSEASKNPIELDSIKDYFFKVKNKYNMINYCDVKQYLDDMLTKIDD